MLLRSSLRGKNKIKNYSTTQQGNFFQKKMPPLDRSGLNDCLPYENRKSLISSMNQQQPLRCQQQHLQK
jgi:hypothetical protein